jgi:hypothetical protein
VNGEWELVGDLVVPPNATLILSGSVVIIGNFSIQGTLVGTLATTIVVKDCASISGTLVLELTPEQAAGLNNQDRQTVVNSTSSCGLTGTEYDAFERVTSRLKILLNFCRCFRIFLVCGCIWRRCNLRKYYS